MSGQRAQMSQVCKYILDGKGNPFNKPRDASEHIYKTCVKRVNAYCGFVGYTTDEPSAIIRRARRAMLMNIDVPRQYASLEVNVLALLTLWNIESRGST